MKITKSQLREIIREEIQRLNEESISKYMNHIWNSDGKYITIDGTTVKVIDVRTKYGNGLQLQLDKPIPKLAPNRIISIKSNDVDLAKKIADSIK